LTLPLTSLLESGEDVFREMVLKFTERGHAIINAIEEQKNADTGERTAGKADE